MKRSVMTSLGNVKIETKLKEIRKVKWKTQAKVDKYKLAFTAP